MFEKILLTRILYEIIERRLMRDKLYGFRPRHSTFLQMDHLIVRITRTFGKKKRLTHAVFLCVVKDFETIWIDGLLYKLMLLNFASLIFHTVSSYLRGWTIEVPF